MDEREPRKSRWRKLKLFFGLLATAFTVTATLIVGNRLSDEALGVLAGAVCGVGAAIPTSLLIIAVTRSRKDRQTDSAPARQQGTYPPVVVISPQGGQRQNGGWNALPPSYNADLGRAPMERDFKVVGGSDDREGRL